MSEEKKGMISQNSYVSIGLAVLIVAGLVRNETRMTKIEEMLFRNVGDIKEMQTKYIPREEFLLYLRPIKEQLDKIEAELKRK